MTTYRDKLKTLGFSRHRGTSRVRPVLSDTTGKQVGETTEHWSGRVDAKATKFDVVINPALKVRKDDDG